MKPRLSAAPIPKTINKFVITAGASFFTIYDERSRSPSYLEILAAAFDLEDPSVVENLDEEFEEGRIVLGYYSPGANEISVEFPASPTHFATGRIRAVIGA